MMRSLARPLLASWFVYGGVRDALEPQARTATAEPMVGPMLKDAGLDVPVETLVRVHSAATAATAAVLALSKTPRTAGVALTGLAAVTVATAAPFWRLPEGPEREAALEQFMKNLALMGGAMLAANVGHSAGHIKRKKARKAKAKEKSAKAEEKAVKAQKKAKAERKAT
jgi:putative oxidoreductase